MSKSDYKITVSIECHVQLNTKTKLFSAVDNDAVDKEPNSCVSPIDYALPGMLPVLNKAASEKAVRAGLAMNCKINLVSRFDRKHYYYPDLPKGYQISQMYQPIIGAGEIHLPDGSNVKINHAHLEEDAAKLTHFENYSLVDLNRVGTPLLEIVTDLPGMSSAAQARSYMSKAKHWGADWFYLYQKAPITYQNVKFAHELGLKIGLYQTTTKKQILDLLDFGAL